MRILLTGASGFLGTRVRAALVAHGHQVTGVARHPPPGEPGWLAMDLNHAGRAGDWDEALQGIDAVVNAAGLFRETQAQRFETLHVAAPRALFEACERQGVRRVVQVSALGVERALTGYQRSKLAADTHLLGLRGVDATVVRPSLVFGAEGTSSRTFLALAAAPLIALPGGGHQPLQPVHVDDAAAAICALVETPTLRWRGQCVPLVGPAPLRLRDYLLALRAGLGLGAAPVLAVPGPLVRLAAALGERRPGALFDAAALRMLEQGEANTADPAAIGALLGRAPRPARAFLRGAPVDALRQTAQLAWLMPLLRASLALVWGVTAAVSWWVWPREDSLALLARSGVPPALQAPALAGASLLDGVFALATLAWPRRALWWAQIALMAFYMLVIAWKLPEFWAHPYGPLLKNLPMLAILILLIVLDPRARRRVR